MLLLFRSVMKKFLCIFLCLSFLFLCSCESVQKEEPSTSTTLEESNTAEMVNFDDYTQESHEEEETYTDLNTNPAEITTKAESTTKKAEIDEETTKITAVTYYSESPDNKYIKYIASKFRADPFTLRALIRTNTDIPGAVVLQFNGDTDSNGNLLTTEDTLLYVYDISSDGTVKRATGKMNGNIGYTYVESLAAFALAKKYMIPNLELNKEKRTYEDYFND